MRSSDFVASFKRRDEGAVALVFGLSFMVLIAAMGIAVDYARAFNMQSRLQNDLDAAVLGAGAQLRTAADLSAVASAYFGPNWRKAHGVSDVTLNVTKLAGDKGVTGTASATVPTIVMKIFGFDSIPISATSEVKTASQHVEVSLVLDTTGSMEGSKLDALKTASKQLVDTAFQLDNAQDYVKIGIVPFAQYVNVGMANRNKSWISVKPDSTTTTNVCGMETPVVSKSNCHMVTYTAYNDGTPYTYQVEECDYVYGPPVNVCRDVTNTQAWYGCVGSRNYPLDTEDDTYSTPVPGMMNVSCGAPITPLLNDKDALKTQIDGLVAIGETYIPAGILWGWTTLSKQEPFDEAYGYDEVVDGNKVRKIMVVMTDGTNTISPTYPEHWGSDSAKANTLTSEVCTNVKAKGITIYAVAFDVTDATIQDLLKGCASSPSNFYSASDATELADAFQSIAKDFTPLVLSQ